MSITKDALRLFLISLPSGCSFQIVSFGSRWDWFCPEGYSEPKTVYKEEDQFISYNANSKDQAINFINAMSANYGGTEIY